MSCLTEVSIPGALSIFFLALGPLKALGPFAMATRGSDPAFRRTEAWQATAIAGGDGRQMGIVLGALLVIMALNLITLWNPGAVSWAPSPLLKVAAWVMAVPQAAKAVQYLFNGLVRAGVFHPLSS